MLFFSFALSLKSKIIFLGQADPLGRIVTRPTRLAAVGKLSARLNYVLNIKVKYWYLILLYHIKTLCQVVFKNILSFFSFIFSGIGYIGMCFLFSVKYTPCTCIIYPKHPFYIAPFHYIHSIRYAHTIHYVPFLNIKSRPYQGAMLFA